MSMLDNYQQQVLKAETRMFDKETAFVTKAEELGLTIKREFGEYIFEGNTENIDEFMRFMEDLV